MSRPRKHPTPVDGSAEQASYEPGSPTPPRSLDNTKTLSRETKKSEPNDSNDRTLFALAYMHWHLGNWEDLKAISAFGFGRHPDRAKLALLVACACQQLGDNLAARRLVMEAKDWGCDKRLIAQLLLAGVHNRLARAATLSRNDARALEHFRAAVSGLGGNLHQTCYARASAEFARLGLLNGNSTEPPVAQASHIPDIPLPSSLDPATVTALTKVIKQEISTAITPARANPYVHNRVLTTILNQSLREFFRAALKAEHYKATYIDYLALKAAQCEKVCVGRLATTIQDAIVRQVVAESVEGPHLGVLEIGALFGINLAIIYNHCIARFESVRMICLDPLSGYYGKSVDPVLNIPINAQAFHRNMRLANVSSDDYILIQDYSTSPSALEAVRLEKITLLIIDGDHSYSGVSFDYENYFPLLEPGGYVIFDDYDAKEWPDVKCFVDKVVKLDPHFEFLGSFSRTAVGRKRPIDGAHG